MKLTWSQLQARSTVSTATLLAIGIGLSAPAQAASLIPVDLELWLGVDASGSISTSEFNLQKGGYSSAFSSDAIKNLVTSSKDGIAVGYGYWSSTNQQNVAVNWTLLKTAQDATNFATSIAATTRPFGGGTAIGAGMAFGIDQIKNNEFDGVKKTIDISGDGISSGNPTPATAKANAEALGITINGLAIGNQALTDYYNANVKTSNGFVVSTPTLDTFASAVKQKLTREIGDGIVKPTDPKTTPESGLLFGLGLVGTGLALSRRKYSLAQA